MLFLAAQGAPELGEGVRQTIKTLFNLNPLVPPKAFRVFPHFIGILQGIGNALHANNLVYITESRFGVDIGDTLVFAGALVLVAVQAIQGLAGIVAHNNLALADSDIGSNNNINYLFFPFLKIISPL